MQLANCFRDNLHKTSLFFFSCLCNGMKYQMSRFKESIRIYFQAAFESLGFCHIYECKRRIPEIQHDFGITAASFWQR